LDIADLDLCLKATWIDIRDRISRSLQSNKCGVSFLDRSKILLHTRAHVALARRALFGGLSCGTD